jgi:hypothetical protein
VKNDEHQLWRDERDAACRERDRHREPRHTVRKLPPVRAGSTGAVSTMRLACPVCRGPVWATTDSDREHVGCVGCEAELVTRRALDGSVSLQLVELRRPDADGDL